MIPNATLSARGRFALVSAGLAALATLVRAQPAAPIDPREFAARSITRLALFDLRRNERPAEDDYRIASRLLSIAADITPDDPEILRCRLEAAYACGDDDLVLELTRNLLNLDRLDTVAQLRLITAGIAKNTQNADERIKAYEKFLDPNGPGKVLDPSVLSRLALDEALLLREAGDDQGFIHKLTLATQLDSTHKEAQQLAATVFAERRPDDRVGRLKMMEHVLMADPVDANVHLSIAHELVAGRAFKAAQRFQDNAQAILIAAGASTDRLLIEAYVLTWQSKGPAQVIAQLNHELAVARDRAEREVRRLREKGQPLDKALKPEDVRLSAPLRFVYIMALATTGEAATLDQAVSDLTADFGKMRTQLRQSVERGEITADQATRTVVDMTVQLDSARVLTGIDVDAVRKDLEEGGLLAKDDSDSGTTLNGWLAIRASNFEEGRRLLEPIAESAPLAGLGVGLSYELAGQKDQAIAAYRRVSRDRPLDMMGAWADSRAAALGAKDDLSQVAALEAAVADVPEFVDRLVSRPQEFEQLRVSVLTPHPEAIDRVGMRIAIQNISRIPFALGADRTIASRLLLAPKLEAAGDLPPDLVQPEVIDLDRRLRLMPNETLVVDCWPDVGQSGWLMEAIANRSTRVRWRVIQGFQIVQGAGFAPGVMGLTTETDSVVRLPIAEASLPPDALAAAVASEPAAILLRLAAATRTLVYQPMLIPFIAPAKAAKPAEPGEAAKPAGPAAPEVTKAVADAFAARYPKLTPVERAMLAAVLPHARLAPVMASVDQVMRAETDPVPLCVVLVTRVSDPADELLTASKGSEDPRVKEIAELVQRRLASDAKPFAKLVPADVVPLDKRGDRAAPPAPPAAPPGGGGK